MSPSKDTRRADHGSNCIRVCKSWSQLITAMSRLWREIDLTTRPNSDLKVANSSSRNVSNAFISHCINRSFRQITSAKLARLKDVEKPIAALTHSCKSLSRLELHQTTFLSNSVLDHVISASALRHLKFAGGTSISSAGIADILHGCPMLESLTCLQATDISPLGCSGWPMQLPKLQHLHLVASRSSPPAAIHTVVSTRISALVRCLLSQSPLLSRIPNIVSLSLGGMYLCTIDTHIDLGPLLELSHIDFAGCTFAPLLASIDLPNRADIVIVPQKIVLMPGSGVHVPRSLTTCTVEYLIILLTLYMQRSSHASQGQSSVGHIRQLTLWDARGVDEELRPAFEKLLKSPIFALLEELHFKGNASSIDDHIIEILVEFLPKLQSLTLHNSPVTGVSIRLLLSLEHLRELELLNCPVADDAVELVRSKGIRVKFSRSD